MNAVCTPDLDENTGILQQITEKPWNTPHGTDECELFRSRSHYDHHFRFCWCVIAMFSLFIFFFFFGRQCLVSMRFARTPSTNNMSYMSNSIWLRMYVLWQRRFFSLLLNLNHVQCNQLHVPFATQVTDARTTDRIK